MASVDAGRILAPVLAPVVDRLANWLDRRAGESSSEPILRARAPGEVHLRPVTAKILAYDETGSSGTIGFGFACFFGFLAGLFLHESVKRNDARAVVVSICFGLITAGCVLWSVGDMSGCVRRIRRHIAQCAVVQGRVTAAQTVLRGKSLQQELCLRVEYTHMGRLWRGEAYVGTGMGAIIGWTPVLLVDAQNPASFLFRDLYI